jgi:glycosyltransferase involved in cell wall biosynthesis
VTPLRLLFVSLYFSPARSYGGPIVSLARMVDELAFAGDDCCVVTTNADGATSLDAGTVRRSSGALVHYCRRAIAELFAPWAVVTSVAESWRRDVVYVWGIFVWLLPILLLVQGVRGLPLVVSPRGMLYGGAIRRHGLRKTLFLRLLRYLGIERVAVFHVTAESEIAAVEKYFPSGRCVYVPNGVDPCNSPRSPRKGRYLLFLGRIDPIKRIELIIGSYAIARRRVTEPTRLIIAGDGDESYLARLKSLTEELDPDMNVEFRGFVAGLEKSELLASASALVLCSRSENFGIAVAEALAAGTPVIATTTTPWGGIEEKRVGWYVDDSEQAISESMVAALHLSEEDLREISLQAKQWMLQDFAWRSVATRLREVFRTQVERSARTK